VSGGSPVKHWLLSAIAHGAAAGIAGGAALLAADTVPASLIGRQPGALLATLLYLTVCAQIGAVTGIAAAGLTLPLSDDG
jgi:hypothetical protein